MNEKTAKLIRDYARVSKEDPRGLKREWASTPRPERAALRRRMQLAVAGAAANGAGHEEGKGD